MLDRDNTAQQPETRSRVKSDSRRFFALLLIITALLAVGFYFYDRASKGENPLSSFTGTSQDHSEGSEPAGKKIITTEETSGSNSQKTLTSQDSDSDDVNVPKEQSLADTPRAGSPELQGIKPESLAENNNQFTTTSSFDVAPYVASPDSNDAVDYAQLVQKLNNFYAYLDSRSYMAEFDLGETSKIHFSKVIEKLLENPPVVTRETDDLFTLLKNTAHFFRILGKDNITTLKGILDRERGSFEDILKSFYTLTYSPELLKKEYDITLDQKSLYDYAAFFLHTMGGRLYLFRRDSTSRLTVSFYAVLIIDRANEAGDSPHGIDIRPAIDSLIEEIENGGNNLQMRDAYLEKLYLLQERYSSAD